MIGVTLAAIANLHAGQTALNLTGDPLTTFLQNPACRRTTPPRPGAAEVLAWLDRRKLLTCLMAPQVPAVNEWLDLNGFPSIHIPDLSNALDASRVTRTQIWVLHHSDNPELLTGTHIYLDNPSQSGLQAQTWQQLLRLLDSLPLDYRQKREKSMYWFQQK